MSEIPATPAAVFIVYHMCNPRGLPPIIFNGLGMPVPFFFFQAEDGIRAIGVTGVQTCALPICLYVGVNASNVSSARILLKAPGHTNLYGWGTGGVIELLLRCRVAILPPLPNRQGARG